MFFGEQLYSINRITEEYNTKTVNRFIDNRKENDKPNLIKIGYSCCLEALLDSEKFTAIKNKLLFPTNLFEIVSCDINPKNKSNKVIFGYHYFECNIPLYYVKRMKS